MHVEKKNHFPMPVALSWRAGSSNQPVGYLDHHQKLVQIDPQAVASNPQFTVREHHISGLFPLGVLSLAIASNATFALNWAEWFLLGLLAMLSLFFPAF